MRLAQKLKLDKLAGLLVGWMPPLKDLFQLAPQLPKPLWNDLNKHPPSSAALRSAISAAGRDLGRFQTLSYRVGYFLGCVMNVVFADASRATVKLLEHYNCEVDHAQRSNVLRRTARRSGPEGRDAQDGEAQHRGV